MSQYKLNDNENQYQLLENENKPPANEISITNILKLKSEKYRVEIRKKETSAILNSKRYKILPETQEYESNLEKDKELVEFCQKIKKIQEEIVEHDKTNDVEKISLTLGELKDFLFLLMRRQMSNENYIIFQFIIQSGLFNILLKYIDQRRNPPFKNQAIIENFLWITCNTTSFDVTQMMEQEQIVEFIKILINLMDVKWSAETNEQAAFSLTNISCEHTIYRNEMFEGGLIEKVVSITGNSLIQIDHLRTYVWLISSLVQDKPFLSLEFPAEKFKTTFEFLKKMSVIDDEVIQQHVYWGLMSITGARRPEYFSEIFKLGILPNIIKGMSSGDSNIKTPCRRIICNLMTGEDVIIIEILKMGALNELHKMLFSKVESFRRECCWALGNILGSSPEIIDLFTNHQIFNDMFECFKVESFVIKRELIYAYSNLLHLANIEIILNLIHKGFCSYLLALIDYQETKLTDMVVDCIDVLLQYNIEIQERTKSNIILANLESSNLRQHLEALQMHPNAKIYKKVNNIIEKYFDYT